MNQRIRILYLTLSLYVLNAGVVNADSFGGFNLRAGIGYNYISQEYFLESDSIYLDPDSLMKSALLKKDYLDDRKGFIYLDYASNPENKAKFYQNYQIGWEQTDELFRISSFGRVDKKWKKSNLAGNFRLEIKENYKGSADPGEELTIINGQLDYRFQLSNMVNLRSKIYTESVTFDTVDLYIYNYSRYGVELGFNLFTADLNSVSFNSGFEIRDVPDSNQLDYSSFHGNLGYFGSVLGMQMSADLRLESRNYNQIDNREDYLLLSFNGDTKVPFGKKFFLTAKQDVEYFNYSQNNYINDDYYLARFGLFAGYNFGRFSTFSAHLGPEIELLNINSAYSNDDDYSEIMAIFEVDYFGSGGEPGALFFIIENKFGKRIYKNSSDYRSEFLFERANIIGNIGIFGGLNFDILLSFDLEFHDIKSDNSRLYLVSTGLSYRF